MTTKVYLTILVATNLYVQAIGQLRTNISENSKDSLPYLTIDPLGLVLIPGDTFIMGCGEGQECYAKDEQTLHTVILSDFYLAPFETTQHLWQEIMNVNPAYFKDCPDCPIEQVNWYDVQLFFKKLNEKYKGYNYRLPTEAEWEFAARERGKKVLFGNGTNIADPEEINYDGDWNPPSYAKLGVDRAKTTQVGSLLPNSLGLYDMSGNVWEWCSDWDRYYQTELQINPTGPETGHLRVIRGGAWSSYAQYCRNTYRSADTPDHRSFDIGFRVCRSK